MGFICEGARLVMVKTIEIRKNYWVHYMVSPRGDTCDTGLSFPPGLSHWISHHLWNMEHGQIPLAVYGMGPKQTSEEALSRYLYTCERVRDGNTCVLLNLLNHSNYHA